MFTGIVQAKGRVLRLEPRGGDCRLTVATGKLPLAEVALGDSIAVNGVCLTVVQIQGDRFVADVSRETLVRTTFGELGVGSPINLELALTPTSRLGGHIVSGHVDGVGEIRTLREDGRSVRMAVKVPPPLARYIAEKGSICVDGVSLTVNAVKGCRFEVNLVPHTLAETTLGDVRPGQRVNLEVDLLARYLERLLLGDAAAGTEGAGLTPDLLRKYGFLPDSP